MRNTSPVGWRVTRYDYINRQLYNGADGLGYLNANPPDLWLSADKGLATVGARGSTLLQLFNTTLAPQFSTDSFTVEIWATINSKTHRCYIMGCGAGSSNECGMRFDVTTDLIALVYFTSTGPTGSVARSINHVGAISLDTWNHFLFSVDRTNNTANFYLNSTLAGSTSLTDVGSMSPSVGSYLALGYLRASTGSMSGKLNGNISRARITLGYAYSQADVDVTYNNGNGLLYAEMPSSLQSKVSHAWNLNEASGPALNCVSTHHGIETGTGASTTIGSTDGPRESIVADNSGNDYHLKLVNYSASQKVTHWVTDSDGSEGLRFERASSHYCLGQSGKTFLHNSSLFKQFSYAVKLKWQGSTLANEGICGVGPYDLPLYVAGSAKQLRVLVNLSTLLGSSACYSFSSSGIVSNNSTSWQNVLVSFNGNSTSAHPIIYLDGVDVTGTFNPFSTYAARDPSTIYGFQIGLTQSTDAYFSGIIDYVKVFNVALASSDAVAQAAGSTFAVAPVMDYRFNDGPQESGVSNGDSIAGWKSREGKNYEFNQGTLANRPTWIANANHGQPGILFDGTNDYLRYAAKILSNSAGVLFLVNRNKAATVGYKYSQNSESTQGYRVGFTQDFSTGYFRHLLTYNSTQSVISYSALNSTSIAIEIFGFKNGSNFYRLKGSEKTLSVVGSQHWYGSTFASTDLANSVLGASFSTALSSPWSGELLELIAYEGTKTPSTNDILAIERYLLTKYGIST